MFNFDNVSELGENNTHIVDLSLKEHNATIHNNASPTISGKYNGAFEFDGSDDYITTDYYDEVKTISFWMNTYDQYFNTGWHTDPKNRYILSQRWDTDEEIGEWCIDWYFSPNLRIWAYQMDGGNPDGQTMQTNTEFLKNTWYHVLITSNGTTVKFYINGQLDSTHSHNVVLGGSNNDDNLILGGGGANEQMFYFNGSLDEVRVWNRTLNEDEIYQQYVSNLRKFNSTQWYLYINQSKNATSGLDEGSYTFEVFAKNDSSNSSSSNATITLDTSAPVFTNLNNQSISYDESLNYDIDASDLTSIDTFWIDNSNFSINSAGVLTNATGLSIGTYWITVYVNDTLGHTNSDSIKVDVNDEVPCNVTLLSPVTSSGSLHENITFEFTVSDISSVSSCSLISGGSIYGSNNDIQLDTTENITLSSLSVDRYNWYVNCTDSTGNTGKSNVYTLDVFVADEFSSVTDFSTVNTSDISNLIIQENSNGSISFTQSVNLSGGANLNDLIDIRRNYIYVDSGSESRLDKSATITFNSLSYVVTPYIYKDGSRCFEPECSINFYNSGSGTLSIDVSSFSSYTTGINSRLRIGDETEIRARSIEDNVSFWANYTNITSNVPIIGAGVDCKIRFNVGGWSDYYDMDYNSTSELYEYQRTSFDSTGYYDWEVSCDGSSQNYEPLSTIDEVVIGTFKSGPSGATIISEENFGRYNSHSPSNVTVESGNISSVDLNTNMSTYRWSGLLGNVTGKLMLGDSDDNLMYEWNASGRLVYVCNESSIDWYALIDAESQHMPDYLDGHYSDSYNNTFHGYESINSGVFNFFSDYANTSSAESTVWKTYSLRFGYTPVWVGRVEEDGKSYSNDTIDYQMLIPENGGGGNDGPTPYYIWIELV